MPQQPVFFPLRGGLNLVTPAIETPPGHLIGGLNYEPVERGYGRVDGFERYDGQLKPSEAGYWLLEFDQGDVAEPAQYETITGGTSGVTATVLHCVVASGAFADGDAAGTLVLIEAEGAPVTDDFITIADPLDPLGDNTLTRASVATHFNSSGVLIDDAVDEHRFTYVWDGVSWENGGLLVEPQRTNLIRNNTPHLSAVVGTPGTLPTNWTLATAATLSSSVVSYGTSTDGISYVDVRVFGTPTATSSIYLYLDDILDVPGLQGGDPLTFSAFLALSVGSWSNFRELTALVFRAYDDSNNLLATYAGDTITDTDGSALGEQRRVLSTVVTEADAVRVRPAVRFSFTNGAAISATLRIGFPQLELGDGASSVIKTTTAAATRSADILTRSFDGEGTYDVTITRSDVDAFDGTVQEALTSQLASGGEYVVGTSILPIRTIVYDDSRPITDASRQLFESGEPLSFSGGGTAVATAAAQRNAAETEEDDETWTLEAIARARAAISQPSGTGPVRAVWTFEERVYCIRDINSQEAAIFRATDSGWQRMSLGWVVLFTSGTDEFVEGEVVTGSGGAVGTIGRVILESGTWAGNNAAGRLILTAKDGDFDPTDTLTGSIAGGATVASGSQGWPDGSGRQYIPAGGRYDIDIHNFFGQSDWRRCYLANGVGRAFEYDGEVFAEIRTGLSDDLDKPTHVAAHKNNLFLSYRGGSIQFSSTGDPHTWNVLTGAAEFSIGADITAMQTAVAGVLVLFARTKISVLYGSDVDDFSLSDIANDSGAEEWTVQNMSEPVYLDQRAIRQLSAAQEFGNFKRGALSGLIDPLLLQIRRSDREVVASLRVRGKDQYRVYWDDGYGLTMYIGRERPETIPFSLGVSPTCTWSGEIDGKEVLLMGSADGWVYQLDAGTSFDGEEVQAFVRLPFHHMGTPQQHKRFHKVVVEVDARPDATMALIPDVSYGDPQFPGGQSQSLDVQGGGGFWDEDDLNEFNWSSPVEGIAETHVDAIGKSLSLAVISRATHENPHILHGVTTLFSPRGLVR